MLEHGQVGHCGREHAVEDPTEDGGSEAEPQPDPDDAEQQAFCERDEGDASDCHAEREHRGVFASVLFGTDVAWLKATRKAKGAMR